MQINNLYVTSVAQRTLVLDSKEVEFRALEILTRAKPVEELETVVLSENSRKVLQIGTSLTLEIRISFLEFLRTTWMYSHDLIMTCQILILIS